MTTKTHAFGSFLAALLVSSAAVTAAYGHDTAADQRGRELFQPGLTQAEGAGEQASIGRPPLYQGLGHMTLPITATDDARAYFDQGLRLTWGFNHAEAWRAFREAQRRDPNCAMCLWGEAFALGPNINDVMHDDAVQPAWEAIERALALKDGVTPKERALIEALARRYSADPRADRSTLNQAWADAIGEVAETYTEDANILVLYADALMNLQPWDYWEADGVTPKRRGGEIVSALERALEFDPHHPAAAHLYIHAVEASADPGRAEAAADNLRGAVPAAGHLVHMPAHIYNRVGRYQDSIEVNRDAVAADEAFLASAGDAASPLYRFGYYPHNVHFLMVAAQMAGVAEDVIASADKLATVTSDEVSAELAWVQAIRTAPYGAHAQFSGPETILELPDPGDRFPFVKGFWHYARGVALARLGNAEAAEDQVEAIRRLMKEESLRDLEAQYLPARDILRIAKRVIQARMDQAQGNYRSAADHLREAIELQDALPYIEPPYWYYPVRQTLAAVVLQDGRAEEAVAIFKDALKETPRNGWALWGLLQAQRAAGSAEAAETQAAFEKAWLGDEAMLSLERL